MVETGRKGIKNNPKFTSFWKYIAAVFGKLSSLYNLARNLYSTRIFHIKSQKDYRTDYNTDAEIKY